MLHGPDAPLISMQVASFWLFCTAYAASSCESKRSAQRWKCTLARTWHSAGGLRLALISVFLGRGRQADLLRTRLGFFLPRASNAYHSAQVRAIEAALRAVDGSLNVLAEQAGLKSFNLLITTSTTKLLLSPVF